MRSKPGIGRLGAILILMLVVIAGWVVYHAWPRKVPEPLFTFKDLQLDTLGEENGWDGMKSLWTPSPKLPGDLEIPSNLEPFLSYPGFPESRDSMIFLGDLKPKLGSLHDFLFTKSDWIAAYQRVLASPRFVDTTPPKLEANPSFLLPFMDLHKIGRLYILSLYSQLKFQEAYAFWLQMFRQDTAWLQSAHSVLSNLMAMGEVLQDLKLLQLLLNLSPPPQAPQILNSLQDFHPEKLNFRNAIIFEYLSFLNGEEAFFRELRQNRGIFSGFFFNQAKLRKDLNLEYSRILKYLKNPSAITQSLIEREKRLQMADESSWHEWLSNPGGRILKRLLSIDLLKRMGDYYRQKKELLEIVSQLEGTLNRQAETRPESAPTESLPSPAKSPPASLPENFDLEAQLDQEPDLIRTVEIPLPDWREDVKEGLHRETLRLEANYSGEYLQGFKVLEVKNPSIWTPFEFKAGDLILALSGRPLTDEDPLFDLKPKSEGPPLEILLFRQGKFQVLEIDFLEN